MNQHSLKTEMEETVVQIRHKGNSLWQIIYIDLSTGIVICSHGIYRLYQRLITECAKIPTFAVRMDTVTIRLIDYLRRIRWQMVHFPEMYTNIRIAVALKEGKKRIVFFKFRVRIYPYADACNC